MDEDSLLETSRNEFERLLEKYSKTKGIPNAPIITMSAMQALLLKKYKEYLGAEEAAMFFYTIADKLCKESVNDWTPWQPRKIPKKPKRRYDDGEEE